MKNALTFPRFVLETESQTTIEGRLPVPEGHTASKPLFFTGGIAVNKTKTNEGSVQTEGEIVLSAVCLDTDGELYSFTSRAPFSHETEADGVKPGMRVRASAELLSLDVSEASHEMLSAAATVAFLFTVEDTMPIYTADLDSLPVAVETHNASLEYLERETLFTAKSRVREEIAFPEIAAVLYSNANAVVRELKSNGSDLSAECLLNIDALCRKRNGEYVQLTQSVPVSITEDHSLPEAEGTISGRVRVTDIQIRALGEEFGILSVEAVLDLDVYSTRRCCASFPDDAYTPTECRTLKLEQANEKALLYKGERDLRSMFTEEIQLTSQPNRIIFTGVRPIITSAVKNPDGTELQGIAELTVIYLNEDQNITAAREERAFSITTNLTGESIEAEITGSAASANITGSGASVTYTVTLKTDEYAETAVDPIIAAQVEDSETKKQSGFTVYFAGEGETVFEIAKRHKVPTETLHTQNPGLGERMREGEKVVFLDKR